MVRIGNATHCAVVEYLKHLSCFKAALTDFLDGECSPDGLNDVSYHYCLLLDSLKDAHLSGAFSDAEFTKELQSIIDVYLRALNATNPQIH